MYLLNFAYTFLMTWRYSLEYYLDKRLIDGNISGETKLKSIWKKKGLSVKAFRFLNANWENKNWYFHKTFVEIVLFIIF